MSACSCFALLFSLIAAIITGVILYFILKYRPGIEKAVKIIYNLDSESLDNTVTKVNEVVDKLDSTKVSTAITAIENIVDKLDVDDVTAAINTIENVAEQLDNMMNGKDLGDTALGGAIEKYICANLPDTIEPTFTLYDGDCFGQCDSNGKAETLGFNVPAITVTPSIPIKSSLSSLCK